jgi:Domain of unknown function (DUF6471)
MPERRTCRNQAERAVRRSPHVFAPRHFGSMAREPHPRDAMMLPDLSTPQPGEITFDLIDLGSKISRGGFTAVFFVQCSGAIECHAFRID